MFSPDYSRTEFSLFSQAIIRIKFMNVDLTFGDSLKQSQRLAFDLAIFFFKEALSFESRDYNWSIGRMVGFNPVVNRKVPLEGYGDKN
jgi:hypothetical protein